MAAEQDTFYFDYTFTFPDGVTKNFRAVLEAESLGLVPAGEEKRPEWTNLDFHKCTNCPLDPAEHSHCPVAVSLVDLVDFFRTHVSYEEVDVSIETGDRNYSKHTTLNDGLSSLVGIYMVASGCPVMEKLKPMVRFHQPFASEDETKFRVMSMYLLAQFFMQRNGIQPDWELKDLVNIYEDIRAVNKGFCHRLANIHIKDASLNALVNLDCFAMSIAFSITQNMMDEIEMLFSAYLK